MIRKPILITTLIGQNQHSASIDTGTYQLVDGVASNTILEALDASVQLSIDGASSSASIRLETGTNVDIRAFVEMFTIQGSAGIFRTRSPQVGYGSNSTTIQLEHAINELGDFIITDTFEKEMTLENALKKVFSYYSAKSNLWKLGKVAKPQDPDSDEETAEKCVLSVDYNNCLEALQSIMEQYPYMMLQFDFAKTPWVLNVLNKPTIDEAQGRLSRNVKNATVTRDDSEMYNRVYAQKKNGKYGKYDAAGYWKNKYGLIETVISGANDTDAIWSKTVKSYIKNHKKPKYSITIEGIELSDITGEALDKLTLGKRMCLALPDYNTTVSELITGVSFSSIYKNPTSCTITLNTEEDKVIKYIKKAQKEAGKASKSASAARSAAFVDAKVENNILTITKGDGSSVNFSKAVSLKTKKWGDGTFTVEGTQTNKNTSTGENEEKTVLTATTTLTSIKMQTGKKTTRNATYNLDIPLKVAYYNPDATNKESDTGYTQTVRVSAKPVYDKGWIDGWDNAAGLVVDPDGGNGTSFKMKVPAKVTTTGGVVDRTQVTKNFSLSIDEPSAAGYAKVKLLGVQVARISLTTFWTAGWDDAAGKVVLPSDGTGTSFTVKIPKDVETTGGVIDRRQVTETFTLSIDEPSASGYARVKHLSTTKARISLTTYWTAGWDDAAGKVVLPSSDGGTSFSVKVPQRTETTGGVVNRSQVTKTFSLSIDTPSASGYARVKLSSTTVGKISLTTYWTGGWDNAAGMVVLPGSGSSATFKVKVPEKTETTGGVVDRDQVTKTFTLSVSGDNALVKLSGTTVAQVSISSVTPTVTKKLVENTSTSPSHPNATFITGLGSVGANKRVYITVGGTRVTSTIFYLTT